MTHKVYSVVGDSAEVLAYGMAKYSRSSMSLAQSMAELSVQRAEQFLNTFYFQYGHGSIADLAHVALAIEDISILAALTVVDEPLWDGQERSTRYQTFTKNRCYTPADAPDEYHAFMEQLFSRYADFTEHTLQMLMQQYPKPDAMAQSTYDRTMKARSFDVARYWLPLGTLTSLGQITSARTLEKQISRLMSHELAEIRAIASDMRSAVVQNDPVVFSVMKDNFHHNPGPLLPTLAKYTEASLFLQESRKDLQQMESRLLEGILPETSYGVQLFVEQGDPLTHACTVLLYGVSNLSYRQIRAVVTELTQVQKEDILRVAFLHRGDHDAWLRELSSAPLIFDITMDIGSFRDLNRHRKVTKVLQNPSVALGYAIPDPIRHTPLERAYTDDMDAHFAELKRTQTSFNDEMDYLLPLGTLCRSLHQMDLAEAAYIIELRTGSAGHFSYREIAYQMYERIDEIYPYFAKHICVTNPREVFNPFQR